MGIAAPPPPAKLIMGLLLRDPEETRPLVFQELETIYGTTDHVTGITRFDKTDYYTREMGDPLYRLFISFHALVAPASLPDIKLATNDVESRFLHPEGGRRVNIDPGILTLQNLVLATTKNYSHRIYLGKGIYGDLTLLFQKGSYQPLPWTYPDYRDKTTRRFLFEVREIYKHQLREAT